MAAGDNQLVINIRARLEDFTRAMQNVRRQAQQFSSQLASASVHSSTQRLVEGYRSLNDRLRAVRLSLGDIARITSGIIVSQTFYTMAHSIRGATEALWSFNEAIDYARVSYGALFNSTDLADDFLDTLQQFSVDTIFEYTDLEKMSRKLLAYGIEYKNLMYIIEGLTNIGTLSGDTAALDRLAVALGQINAKGKLQAEEIRQLTNAYAPMYDILNEEFGLTRDQLGSIGDLELPAHEVINAIVDYANDKFGDVADAAMLTITGLNNRIVDSLKVMGAQIIAPFTTFYKSVAVYISRQLEAIQDVYATSGLAGVFEYLVPSPELQIRFRQFIANVKNFVSQVIAAFITLKPYLSQIFAGLLDALNLFMAALNTAASMVIGALQVISANTPLLTILTRALIIAAGAWLLFKVQALAAAAIAQLRIILLTVAQAVLFLSRALMSNPILSMLIVLGAALIGLSANANNANSAVSKLLKTLSSHTVGGNTADDILQVGDAIEEEAPNSDQFWDRMEAGADDASDAIDGVGDAADKAGKKAKGLLSFDEVFKLPDNAADAAAGAAGSGLGDLDGIGDLADALSGLGAALVPEIPDLSNYAKDFISTLYGELWDAVKVIASGAATGALIGGLVGFAIGGLVTRTMAGALAGAGWGARIGSIAGAGFAAFWTDTYKEMEASLLKIATSSSIGLLTGGLAGLVIGAFATRSLAGALTAAKFGSALGAFIGAGVGGFWALATEEMSNAIEGIAVGGATGMLIGGLIGLLLGAFSTRTIAGALTGARVGASIGSLVGGALGGIFGAFETELQNHIKAIAWGGAEGALVGGLAGLIIGAFATKTLGGALTGAKWGSALGSMIGVGVETIFGDSERTIAERLEGIFKDVSAASTGALIGGLAGMLVGAIVGAFAGAGVGALPGAKIGAAIGASLGGLAGLLVSYMQNSGITEALGAWIGTVGPAAATYLADAWGSITAWGSETIGKIVTWFNDIGTKIGTWCVDTWTKFITWLSGIDSGIVTWCSDVWNKFTTWLSDVSSGLVNWCKNVRTTVTDWLSNVKNTLATWFNERKTAIATWFSETKDTITTWFADVKTSVTTWFDERKTALTAWFIETKTTVTTWFAERKAAVTTWFAERKQALSTWFAEVKTSVTTWFSNIKVSLTTWFAERKTALTTWFNGVKTNVTTWFDERKTAIVTWFNEVKTAVTTWFNERKTALTTQLSEIKTKILNWFNEVKTSISTWFSTLKTNIKTWWDKLFDPTTWKSGWSSIKTWFSDLWSDISGWFSSLATSVSNWWDGLWDDKKASVNISSNTTSTGVGPSSTLTGKYTDGTGWLTKSTVKVGHAYGGIFNREHIARFAEGDKAEMVVPLENASAMQPFVQAVSQGIVEGLAPALAGGSGYGNNSSLPPMYVGTLVADERGLKQLYKKFEIIQIQENARRGITT